MKKDDNELNQVLNLGSLHDEEEKKIKKRKIRFLPLILFLLGLILIGGGIFYEDISSFIKNDVLHEKVKNKKKQKNDNILTCTNIYNDQTIGLNRKTINTYTFSSKKLKKLNVTTIYDVIENRSDIGTTNITLYKEKYTTVIESLKQVNGVKSSLVFKDNILTIKVSYDLVDVDSEKIPDNDYIKLVNSYNESRRDIKKTEEIAGNICT